MTPSFSILPIPFVLPFIALVPRDAPFLPLQCYNPPPQKHEGGGSGAHTQRGIFTLYISISFLAVS
jgi:hypothetical protein